MIERLRRHLSFANVTAALALFVALGGTAYAVTALPKNSVGPKQLKPNAVSSAKVKDGSLEGRDFKQGSLLAGPKGDPGPQGPEGPAGPPGVSSGPAAVPAVSVTNSISQSTPNNANVGVTFDTESFDTQGLHSAVAPARLTAPIAGVYEVAGSVAFTANATGTRTMELSANGTTGTPAGAATDAGIAPAAGAQYLSASGLVKLAAGEYVEMRVTQSSGGALSVLGVGNFAAPRFSMLWVAPVS